MKRCVSLLLAGMGYCALAQAATPNADGGRVDFLGKITDTSCTVSVNGQGSDANVYLAPVSLQEVHNRGAGAYLKPKPFTIQLGNCQIRVRMMDADDGPDRISVSWVGGNLLQGGNEDAGYLANSLSDGASNIALALSINGNDTLDKTNKIIPADPDQNSVQPEIGAKDIGTFTYYIGYVTQTPKKATSGPVRSYATYEIVYN
ncbi:type 1 fimbrial protein [Serratia rubidaea]|uniref:fimbrial protein n=1 Tax=Serratia rubidaea TaxID=61652 RepID=UPI003B82F323|nr:type 1 fimbrial protein [Serratia rubidaea]UJD84069.1 type 1 fimbrial protein [Serratia rubidaea]